MDDSLINVSLILNFLSNLLNFQLFAEQFYLHISSVSQTHLEQNTYYFPTKLVSLPDVPISFSEIFLLSVSLLILLSNPD